MLSVKYILLVKHFEGKTSKEEEQEIVLWQNENIVNNLTYKRLKRVWEENSKCEDDVKMSHIEEKIWRNIFEKIVSEENSGQNKK